MKEKCLLIDVAISGERHMIKKKTKKTVKYKDLSTEVECVWNVKTKVIVITGATGTISKLCRKNLSNILGKHEIKELQKTALLGTAKVLI